MTIIFLNVVSQLEICNYIKSNVEIQVLGKEGIRMRRIFDKGIAGIIVIAIIISCMQSIIVHAVVNIPAKPVGNIDYGNFIAGVNVNRGNAGWDASKQTYWAYNGEEMGGSQGNVLASLNGVTMNSTRPYVVKTTLNVASEGTRDGRIGLIVAGNNLQNFTVLWYWFESQNFNLGVFKNGVHDSWLGSSVNYNLAKDTDKEIVVLRDKTNITVWVGDTLIYNSLTIQEYTGSVIGFESASWGTGAVNYSKFSIYHADMDIPQITDKPVANKNHADEITGVTNLSGTGGWNSIEKYYSTYLAGESTDNNTVYASLDGMSIDSASPYVVKTKVNVAATRDGRIGLILAGNDLQNFTVLWYWLESKTFNIGVYKNGNHESWIGSSVKYDLPRDTDTELVILRDGTNITVWVGGLLIYDSVSVQIPEYTGSIIGFQSAGWYNGLVVFKSFDIYYTIDEKVAAIRSIEKKISIIPTITRNNFIEENTNIIAARTYLDKLLSNYDDITTADISNYSTLTFAEERVAYWESHKDMIQEIVDVESKIKAIPHITPDNYEAESTGSIKSAREAVNSIMDTYPELHFYDILDYEKLIVMENVASTKGIPENLLYNVTGIDKYYTFDGDWDPWGYDMVFNNPDITNGESTFRGINVDSLQSYCFEVTISAKTQMDINGWTRVIFKGSDINDYLYVGFAGDTVAIYDPVNHIEQNLVGIGTLKREIGKDYRVKIITTFEFVTVIVDEKVIINSKPIDGRYTGGMFGCYTYQAHASFSDLKLYYYNGEKATPPENLNTDNLMKNITGISGPELGFGFYGTYNSLANRLDVMAAGIGGLFSGINVDNKKPCIYKALVTTKASEGDIRLVIDGDNAFEHLYVSIGNDNISIGDTVYASENKLFAKTDFVREAGKSYQVTILRELDKVSIFIDNICYIKNAKIETGFSEGLMGAYTAYTDVASISAIDIHYAQIVEITQLNNLKNNNDTKPTPDENNPDTGDAGGNSALVSLLLLIALLALLVIIFAKKRHLTNKG